MPARPFAGRSARLQRLRTMLAKAVYSLYCFAMDPQRILSLIRISRIRFSAPAVLPCALLLALCLLLPAASQAAGDRDEGGKAAPVSLQDAGTEQGQAQGKADEEAANPPAEGTEAAVILPVQQKPQAKAEEDEADGSAAPAEAENSNEAAGQDGDREEDGWVELEPGLHYAELKAEDFLLYALRIDPEHFSFVLCSSGREKCQPQTLQEWSEKHNLVAAINASMYLTDGITSTGYMRDGSYCNNSRIVQRFGAFFAADPDDAKLPSATILEKDDDMGEELLSHYRLVIQNYRIINSKRRILWSPGGPLYSISAVALDEDGNILFLHSKVPIEAYTFAQQLLHLPLNIRTVMYVEGGGQAGLVIRSQKFSRQVQGDNLVDFFITGNRIVRLPNVLGIRRKH